MPQLSPEVVEYSELLRITAQRVHDQFDVTLPVVVVAQHLPALLTVPLPASCRGQDQNHAATNPCRGLH